MPILRLYSQDVIHPGPTPDCDCSPKPDPDCGPDPIPGSSSSPTPTQTSALGRSGIVADGTVAHNSAQAGAIWGLRESISEGLRHRGAPSPTCTC